MTALETFGLCKRFGAFTALDDVSLKIGKHSFHALLGENGAGKSTLVKCFAGFHAPTSGQFSVNGFEKSFGSPFEAHGEGIGMVYQHFTSVENMTVAENFLLASGDIPAVVPWKETRRCLSAFMETMPFSLNLESKVWELSVGERQKLEILKQLYFGRSILILDEPTSTLTPGEAEEVLGYLKELTVAEKLTVLIITHKFKEVMEFCDSVSILRKGRHVATVPVCDTSEEELATFMVGNEKSVKTSKSEVDAKADIILEVRDLETVSPDLSRSLKRVSFKVSKGEILGIAGVSGNGQDQLLEVLSGHMRPVGGQVRINGEDFRNTRGFLKKHRMAVLPEMPIVNGFVPSMTVAENLALRNFDEAPISSSPLYVSKGSMGKLAEKLIAEFKIALPGMYARIDQLSGGNIQRAILAREFNQEPELLIAANPCFGLDFQAAGEIRSRIIQARNNGSAVLLISEDLDEILELADRILVFFEGRAVASVDSAEANPALIGTYMAGNVSAGTDNAESGDPRLVNYA